MKTAAKFGIIFGSFAALAVAGALKADARLPFKSQKEIVGKAPEARWLAKSPKPEFGGIRYRLKASWIGFGLGFYARTGGGGATGITPAMAMLTAYSRTLTDEVAAYEATYTGASHKTMFDQYGKLTFAPNNFATQSNTFNAGDWLKFNSSVASGVSDPDGGSSAWTLTATSASGFIRNIAGAQNYQIINSIWIKRRTGTGQVTLTSPDGTLNAVAVTTSWQQFYYKSAPQSGTSAVFTVTLATSGDEVDIYQAQREYVTHETTPRAYNATTSAAYYGYRCVYAPETLEASTTSITIGSGSSYTFTTAAAHSFAVGDVVQATDNADPDNWVRGYVTATTSTTVTLASYTFPGTAYSRPVLTNGSGTISDWSVIRSDGYLAEPAATNGLVNSNTFTGNKASITASAIASMSGEVNASAIVPNSATDTYMGILHTGVGAAATRTYSVDVKAGAATWIFIANYSGADRAWFNISTGSKGASVDSGGGYQYTDYTIKSLKDGWFRITGTGNLRSNAFVCAANADNSINYTGDGSTVAFYAAFQQTELGSVATSYIPTAASSVARSADVDSLSTATWWNGSGTFFTRAKTPAVGALSILKLDDGTANEVIDLYTNGTDPVLQITDGGATQLAPLDLGTVTANTFHDYAIRIAANNVNGALDGTAVTADTTATLPTVTALSMGEHGGVAHLLYFTSEEIDSVLETGSGA